MQNTLKFIDSLTNDSINKIRNSKSDAEARRILKETNAEFLQSCVVGQSEQLKSIDSLDFYNWYKGEGYYSNNREHFNKYGHGVNVSDLKISYKEFITF
jgi:hypothetical protein